MEVNWQMMRDVGAEMVVTCGSLLVMQPVNRTSDQDSRSFIEEARRSQIVDCAVEVIAEVGYSKASIAKIAERADISRGLVSYHFSSKRELMTQVVLMVYGEGAAFMGPRIDSESTAAGQLRAYIRSNLEYMRAYPERMLAAVEITASQLRGAEPIDLDPVQGEEQMLEPLVQLFAHGQAVGEFRSFNTGIMARALRSVIDSVPPHIGDKDFDFATHAVELTTLFDAATRKSADP